MVADMVAFVASQSTTSTWDVGAQELCSVVLIKKVPVGEADDGDRHFVSFRAGKKRPVSFERK